MNPRDRAIDAYRSASSKDPRVGKRKRGKKWRNKVSEQEAQVHGLLLRQKGEPVEIDPDSGSVQVVEAKPSSGAEKAAKFLLLLDKNNAAEILSHLEESEIEELLVELARVKRIDGEEARNILKEFGIVKAKGGTLKGGPEAARNMLSHAFGEERANNLVSKVMPFGSENPFEFLRDLEFQQILIIMKREPASVVSVVLPYIESKTAAAVLEALHPDLQMDVVRRIAKMREVSPEALLRVAEVLRERIKRQGGVVTEEIDGRAALARILRHMSLDKEEEILESLAEVNPEVSEEIRDQLITMDVVFMIDDQDLQGILREFADTEIAKLLKGKTGDLRRRIFANISERRQIIVREEMARLGPMKLSDVLKVTREFLGYIREMEEGGRLVIHRDDEYFVD